MSQGWEDVAKGYLSAPEVISEVHPMPHNHLDLDVSPQILPRLVVATKRGKPLEIFLLSSGSFHTSDTQCRTVQTQRGLQTKREQRVGLDRLAWR